MGVATYAIEPLKGIGPVRLADSLNKIRSLGFERIASLSSAEQDCYVAENGGLTCYVVGNKVESISCEHLCTLNGKQLIGLAESQLRGIVGKPTKVDSPIWHSDDRFQSAYEYHELGITIWVEYERVVSVSLWWDGVD